MHFPILGVCLLAPVAIVARAEVFLTDDQAVHVLFPHAALARREIELTEAQVKQIEESGGDKVRSKKIVAYIAKNHDTVLIDQVLGKHEFITFAVAIAADGTVHGVEIMEYRETYGSQVRNETWRKQFEGKTAKSPLKLNTDIKNISGATLSSAHVTGGVRRLLETYEILKPSL
jgi:Na+-translocating ferredoxin:NAD+ oxidoreductase RnfG subunit